MDRNVLRCLKTGVLFSTEYNKNGLMMCMTGDLQIDILTEQLYITGIPQNNWTVLYTKSIPDIIIDDNNIVYHITENGFYWIELPFKYIKCLNTEFVEFLNMYSFKRDIMWVDNIPTINLNR